MTSLPMLPGSAWRVHRALLLVTCLLPAVACAPPEPAVIRSPRAPGGPADSGDREVDTFAALVDAHRRVIGCAPMTFDIAAARVAAAHADDMRRRGYFSHDSPEGLTPFDRLRAAGVRFRTAAENIAWGHATGEAVFAAWLRSDGHRRNIEDCRYTHHGAGRSGAHWTHVFFAP